MLCISCLTFLLQGEIEHEYVILVYYRKLLFFSETVMELQCKTDKQEQNSPNECFT